MIPPNVALGAFGAGAASHVFYFSRGEHHMHGALYVQLLTGCFIPGVLIHHHLSESALVESVNLSLWLLAFVLAGLYFSLIVFRAFFHPLRSFKGPFAARISSLWFSLQLVNSDAHKKVQQYHEVYGDFVRIGSSDLSIADPRAVDVIYGPGSRCTKADWYDLTQPMVSLQTTRNKPVHDRRRRIWSTAFGDQALRGYDMRIEKYRQQLFAHLRSLRGSPINVTQWFNLFSFDVMGDLAFGTSFHMLERAEEHWAIKLLSSGVEPLAFMLPTWLFRIAVAIPGLAAGWWKFIVYCCDRLEERMTTTPKMADVMTALLEPHKVAPPSNEELNMLQGDSQLIVVAGSDTTATTLTALFYELCKQPKLIQDLREELYSSTDDGTFVHTKIQHLKLLNSVIHETLRLHPPVPVALQRKTPAEGIMVGETFVPGNITVYCPQYVLGRSEKCFAKPLEFIPQRWYSESDKSLIRDKSGFAPFSSGSYGCIGKPLALMNIRMLVANLIHNFDVDFAPGETGEQVELGAKTHFTMALGPLNLVFSERRV